METGPLFRRRKRSVSSDPVAFCMTASVTAKRMDIDGSIGSSWTRMT